MLEARQNWHRFRKLLGYLPPSKGSVIALHSGNRVIAGGIASASGKLNSHFEDAGLAMQQPESSWEVLANKYQAASVSFLEREALLTILTDLQKSKLPYPRQLEEIRKQVFDTGISRNKLLQHFGERPIERSWPRRPFFLNLFSSFFAELLPERKIVLLVVQNGGAPESIALEFFGRELRNFTEPEWTGIDLKGLDLFHKDGAQRLINWCESHYLLPTFGVFVSARIWEEALALQTKEGERAAWKFFYKQKSQREVDKELNIEPQPWPLKAGLKWLSFKN